MSTSVSIQNLTKIFPHAKDPAIDEINANLTSGKIIGLVGPDGAGKTTLLRIMAGLLLPSHGKIEILGFNTVKQTAKIHENISYMPQKFGLYDDLTVLQNLNLYADLKSLEKSQKEKTFEKLLEFTSLKPFVNRLAKNLSGGMKQKLALATSLIKTPKVLLLDEPSVGIDPMARRELWDMVTKLREQNITIIWSTSYLDEAEKCDEVLLLNVGKLLFFGPPEELTVNLKRRTYQIREITTDKREVLFNALKDPRLIDSLIQGSSIRIVLKKDAATPTAQELGAGSEAIIKEVKPRFEDAFIEMLHPEEKEKLSLSWSVSSSNNHPNLIEAKNLTKRFDSFTAVNNTNFSVKKGEIFGLLGPNGAGKSTIFKMLCGLLKPSDGKCFIAGVSLQEAPSKARSLIGYMAQKFSLYGQMSVLQNLSFFSGIYPVDQKKATIEKMIHIFSLEAYINSSANEIPLGFKQRLALACSLMHKPEVLFLDEPTSGVDPLTRREFWNHINELVRSGVTVLVTTHFMDEAEYCDRIGLISKGELIMIGSPDELKEKAKSPTLPSPTLEDAFILLNSKKTGGSHA